MPRVVADTNIYISALNFGGLPARLLYLADAGLITLITSEAILDELTRVLRGEKFAWPQSEIDAALRQLVRLSEQVTPTHRLNLIPADPTDNRILECADAGRADFVVSGDRHLLALVRHGHAPILRVGDFLRHVENLNS